MQVAAAKSIPQMVAASAKLFEALSQETCRKDWTFDTALCFDRQTGQPKRFEAGIAQRSAMLDRFWFVKKTPVCATTSQPVIWIEQRR